MPVKPKLKAGCGLFFVFAAGFICGVIAFFAFLVWIIPLSEGWKDERSKQFVTDHIADELELTDEQREEARPIIHETLDRRYRRRKDWVQSDIELMREGLEKLEPILTDDQRERARELYRDWKERKGRFLLPQEKGE